MDLWLQEGWLGVGIVKECGMDMYTLLYLKWITKKKQQQQQQKIKWITTRPCCIAQGTLLNVMWQPGWEGSLEEKRYPYVYG